MINMNDSYMKKNSRKIQTRKFSKADKPAR